MDDLKGKGIMESENNDSPPGGARRAMASAAAPYGRGDGDRSAAASWALQIRGYPGQNQNAPPRSAAPPVAYEPRPRGHPTGLHLAAAHMACPVCRYPYFFDDICVYCACAAAAAAQSALLGQPRAPPPPLTFQGFEDRRCPCCPFFAGRPAEYPWRHVCRCDVCRFFLARACPDCASPQAGAVAASMDALGRLPPPPQPHHQQHPLGGLGTTRNLAHPSAPAAAWRPEGPPPPPPQSSGVAASAGGHRRRIQCSPPASPLDYIAKPQHDDGWCPACLYNRAPTVFEPRTHVCVCEACIKADAAVCPVCANFGKGDSFDF